VLVVAKDMIEKRCEGFRSVEGFSCREGRTRGFAIVIELEVEILAFAVEDDS